MVRFALVHREGITEVLKAIVQSLIQILGRSVDLWMKLFDILVFYLVVLGF